MGKIWSNDSHVSLVTPLLAVYLSCCPCLCSIVVHCVSHCLISVFFPVLLCPVSCLIPICLPRWLLVLDIFHVNYSLASPVYICSFITPLGPFYFLVLPLCSILFNKTLFVWRAATCIFPLSSCPTITERERLHTSIWMLKVGTERETAQLDLNKSWKRERDSLHTTILVRAWTSLQINL